MKDPRLARIPVVVLSADAAAAQRAVSPGVVAALTKPVEFGDLLQLVGTHC
jgi:CheY-like chemotaxis protein